MRAAMIPVLLMMWLLPPVHASEAKPGGFLKRVLEVVNLQDTSGPFGSIAQGAVFYYLSHDGALPEPRRNCVEAF